MFDGKNLNGWTDNGLNCFFGTAFKPGYIGVIKEVKYFMNRFTRANIVNNLRFQGSNDGVTYDDVFLVGQEIHEGWNYYTYPDGQELKYRFYRFFGNATGSCANVGEISFRGVEVIDSNANVYSSCPIELTLNNSSPITLTGTVNYKDSLTPLLTSISPRFGTVKGGESVTFSGLNFVSDITKYSINIDGRPCAVNSATTTQVVCTTASRPGLY